MGGNIMHSYFDIHSHILPGVDDGAKNMEDTRRMLLIAYEEGIRVMVATPHYIAGKENIPVKHLTEICDQVNQIASKVSDEFQIILGNELYYNLYLLDALKRGDALTIDGTRYILVEFPPNVTFYELWEGLNNCIFAGYIPILAHTERYRCLVKNSALVGELIQLGVYIQLNLSCITGNIFDIRCHFSHKLLQKEWVHFLGTDTHSSNERAPRIRKAVDYIKKKYGEKMVKQLFWENPMTMVENKHLPIG
jgi:protein-tyrosine phosphatase